MKPRINPKACNHELFLDFPATKSYLCQILGISRSTLLMWDNLAFWRIASYRNSYPKTHDGSLDRQSPLSPYQAWVLCRIGRLIQQLASADRVKLAIAKNPSYFSIYSYQQSQKEVQKLA